MIITVSGTPGTGKTTAGRSLAKRLGYDIVDLNEFAENAGLITGKDESRNALEIDIDRLKEADFGDNVVIEGHVSHFIPSDLCIVLRTEPHSLRERLLKREWPGKKIDENVEAEVMGVCSVESRELNEITLDFDTTKHTEEKTADLLENIVRSRKFRAEPIDWDIEKYI